MSRVYNLALLGFAGGSALCGLAWSLNTLVIARVVQALLGGILPAITMAVLLRIVPRDRLGAALGLYGLGAVVAPAVGPALGGYLVEYVNWRLIFFINVPVAILGTVAAILALPAFPGRSGRRFDVLGFITVAGGLFALLLALSKGEDWHWTSYRILGLFTADGGGGLRAAVLAAEPGLGCARRWAGRVAAGGGHGDLDADRRADL